MHLALFLLYYSLSHASSAHSLKQLQLDGDDLLGLTSDKLSLLALKSRITITTNTSTSANDDSFTPLSDWSAASSNTSSVCSWVGVRCGLRHRRVVAVDISNMGVGGTIPPEIGNLSFLASLRIGMNSFSGELPKEMAHLHRLKILDLSNNNFGGHIPDYFFQNLTMLQELYLDVNAFNGTIPAPIFNISTLQIIHLRNNSLWGRLPDGMCLMSGRLTSLELSNNMLTGTLPSSLGHCSQLQLLSVSYNNFIGELPPQVGNMTSLQALEAQNNRLNGNIISISWEE